MLSVPDYLTVGNSCLKFALKDPAIAAALTGKSGYARAEITAQQASLAALTPAYQHQQERLAIQKRATASFVAAFTGVENELSALRGFLGDNFSRADPIFSQLGLDKAQPAGQTDLLIYADRAFANAVTLPTDQAALLARRTWNADRFAAGRASVSAAQQLNLQQEDAKSQGVAATDHLYDLIDAFDNWFRPFAKAARRVLVDLPGALEKMGLAAGLPVKPRRPAEKEATRKPPARSPID